MGKCLENPGGAVPFITDIYSLESTLLNSKILPQRSPLIRRLSTVTENNVLYEKTKRATKRSDIWRQSYALQNSVHYTFNLPSMSYFSVVSTYQKHRGESKTPDFTISVYGRSSNSLFWPYSLFAWTAVLLNCKIRDDFFCDL